MSSSSISLRPPIAMALAGWGDGGKIDYNKGSVSTVSGEVL